MKTTRYRVGVGVLVQILHFLIVIRLSQKVLGKNTTGYLDIGHRDLRSKVEIQSKVEIPVVIRMPLVAMLQTLLGRVLLFAWRARVNCVFHLPASLSSLH